MYIKFNREENNPLYYFFIFLIVIKHLINIIRFVVRW